MRKVKISRKIGNRSHRFSENILTIHGERKTSILSRICTYIRNTFSLRVRIKAKKNGINNWWWCVLLFLFLFAPRMIFFLKTLPPKGWTSSRHPQPGPQTKKRLNFEVSTIYCIAVVLIVSIHSWIRYILF